MRVRQNRDVSSQKVRIFFNKSSGDPMLLETEVGLRELHSALVAFLASSNVTAEFAAQTILDPAPYTEFLGGIRIAKSSGQARLSIGADRWLFLEGSTAALAQCVARFQVRAKNGHSHLYTNPISLIIEADDEWAPNSAS